MEILGDNCVKSQIIRLILNPPKVSGGIDINVYAGLNF